MTVIRFEPWSGLEDFVACCHPRFRQPGTSRTLATVAEARRGATWNPAADVSETDAAYLITADVPAVAKEDLTVTVDDGVVTISGERRREIASPDEVRHLAECGSGRFARSFCLPDDADMEAIQAESRNGVLKVRVPKLAAARPRTVEVQVN